MNWTFNKRETAVCRKRAVRMAAGKQWAHTKRSRLEHKPSAAAGYWAAPLEQSVGKWFAQGQQGRGMNVTPLIPLIQFFLQGIQTSDIITLFNGSRALFCWWSTHFLLLCRWSTTHCCYYVHVFLDIFLCRQQNLLSVQCDTWVCFFCEDFMVASMFCLSLLLCCLASCLFPLCCITTCLVQDNKIKLNNVIIMIFWSCENRENWFWINWKYGASDSYFSKSGSVLKGLDTQITEAGVQTKSKPGRQTVRQRYKTTRQAQRSINKGSGPTLSRKTAGRAA